jgi:uncharacterized protein
MRSAMDRRSFFRFLRLAAVGGVCLLAAGPPAAAEGGIPDFFSHLFGGGAPAAKPPDAPAQIAPPPPVHKPRKKVVRDFVPATATRVPGAPGGEPVEVKFHIYVLGDSFAVSTSDGLAEAFADKREIAIVDKAREASGLVRDDYFDWRKTSSELATGKDKIEFVVVMMGVNDVQPLIDGSETLDPLSDRWREIYGQRVEAFVAPFRTAHIPVAWVGLPPMRSDKFNAAAIKLNEVYKEQAEKADEKYIDIWDAFSNQSGQYDAFGPNIDGQSVKLRGVDGIQFTKAGSRKVAQFLEAEIRRTFEKNNPQSEVANLPPDIEHAADDINAQIRREMSAPAGAGAAVPQAQVKPPAGPILSLTAHPLSPGGALATREAKTVAETVEAARALHGGDVPASRAGRADDFSWPRL